MLTNITIFSLTPFVCNLMNAIWIKSYLVWYFCPSTRPTEKYSGKKWIPLLQNPNLTHWFWTLFFKKMSLLGGFKSEDDGYGSTLHALWTAGLAGEVVSHNDSLGARLRRVQWHHDTVAITGAIVIIHRSCVRWLYHMAHQSIASTEARLVVLRVCCKRYLH